jgi:hypothetical protein
MIKKSKESISKYKEHVEPEVSCELVFSEEEEEERFKCFLNVVRNIVSEKPKQEIIKLPSWREIRNRTGNYFILREMLRRRSNQSTWSRLKECGLISRRA